MRPSVCALVLLLAFGPTPGRASEESPLLDTGPLRFRDQFILSLGFLAFEPATATVLEPGKWEFDAVLTTSNSWALSAPLEIELDDREQRQEITLQRLAGLTDSTRDGSLIFADGEVTRTVLALRRGFSGGIQVELTLPLVTLSGGAFDGAVESFHETLGLEQAGRLGSPKDDFLIFLDTRKGLLVEEEGSSLELGDLIVSLKYRLVGADDPSLRVSLEGLIKLPTGSDEPLASSGRLDFGAQLLVGRDVGPWSFHGSAGALLLGSSEYLGTDSQALLAGLVGIERLLGARTSLVLQGSASQSPFQELRTARIHELSIQVTGGIKQLLGRKNVLFVGATENLQNFNNSADVSLHIGISRAFD
jgi:hypothetical protein